MIYAIYDIYAFRGGLFAVFPALPKSASRATSHFGGYSYLLLQRLRKTVPLSPCSLMQFGKKIKILTQTASNSNDKQM